MSRRLLVTFTLLAVVAVPACSLGGTGTGAADTSGTLATPTPTVVLELGGSDTLPPGEFAIELEMTYLLVPTVGTDERVIFSTVIPLLPEFTSTNLAASGEGDILDDLTFTVGEATAHNVADWIVKVDATLDPAMGAEPLSLHFDLKGQGYATIDEIVQLGAHMDEDAIAYEYSLTLPLEDGASKSFDVEGWKDIKEWTVVLPLK